MSHDSWSQRAGAVPVWPSAAPVPRCVEVTCPGQNANQHHMNLVPSLQQQLADAHDLRGQLVLHRLNLQGSRHPGASSAEVHA